MARTAETSGAPGVRSKPVANAASADRPRDVTASTTRAAAASAGAPGAQGVLAKTAARQHEAVREVPNADRSSSRSLNLGHRESTPAALNDHVVILYGEDRARIDAFVDIL